MAIDYKSLPVYAQKQRILDTLKDNQVIVVQSPTGSGKTTQLPVILYEAGYAEGGVIAVTQPRRIAALSVSEFISKQLHTRYPGLVGYKMRFEDKTDETTRIKIMTDGILLQEMKLDPWMKKYSVIIVDEADDAEAQQPLPFRTAGEFHDGDRAVKLRPFDGFQRVFIAVSDIDQRRVKGFLQEVSRTESTRLQWIKGHLPAVERHAGLAGDDAWRREFHLAMLQAALCEQILYPLLQQQVACRSRMSATRSVKYGLPIVLRPCRRQQKTCQQHAEQFFPKAIPMIHENP